MIGVGVWRTRLHRSIGHGKTLALCPQCDPATKKWHGKFDRISAKGFILYSDGFLYTKEDVGSDNFKYRMKHQGEKMVREILEEGGYVMKIGWSQYVMSVSQGLD